MKIRWRKTAFASILKISKRTLALHPRATTERRAVVIAIAQYAFSFQSISLTHWRLPDRPLPCVLSTTKRNGSWLVLYCVCARSFAVSFSFSYTTGGACGFLPIPNKHRQNSKQQNIKQKDSDNWKCFCHWRAGALIHLKLFCDMCDQ